MATIGSIPTTPFMLARNMFQVIAWSSPNKSEGSGCAWHDESLAIKTAKRWDSEVAWLNTGPETEHYFEVIEIDESEAATLGLITIEHVAQSRPAWFPSFGFCNVKPRACKLSPQEWCERYGHVKGPA